MKFQRAMLDSESEVQFDRGQQALLGLADVYGNSVPETLKSWCTRKRTTFYGQGKTTTPKSVAPPPKKGATSKANFRSS
jgi:hypothetical protein